MRSPAFAGLVVLVGFGCGGTEPVELAANYTLSGVEGQAPPRLVGATVECDVSIVGGRVTFDAPEQPVPDDYFELGLDVLMDCSRAGGSVSESTYGYTGTVELDHRRVLFHTARGGGPLVFEGVLSVTGQLETVVPLLVPTADELSVEFAPE